MVAKPSRVPYLEITAVIREQIRSGQLAPGDQLKTVRALAAEHSVAQGTIGSALELLRSEGLIDTVRGKGSVVIAVPGDVAPQADTARLEAAMREMETRLTGEITDVREYAERLHAQVMALEDREGRRHPDDAGAASSRGVG